MGSSAIAQMMSRQVPRRKPFAFVIAAPKWSRLNHVLAVFRIDYLFVGWPCFLSRPGTSSPPALSGFGLIAPTDSFLPHRNALFT
jgi:hypothetical protein